MSGRHERGVSLIELLVAVTILAIGVVPLMGVIMYGLNTGNRANMMTIATNLARDMSEEIRSQAFAEEFVYGIRDTSCTDAKAVPQCFGLESGETVTFTYEHGGRVMVFDDVDDYNGWCRGKDCSGTYVPLETYDGVLYNGNQGYPPYLGFTRRVRVRNLDVGGDRPISEFRADPFPQYTATSNVKFIKRYDFRNWSALRLFSDGSDTTGVTPLKRIEVTVTYDGPVVKGIEVIDVSYVVQPFIRE